MTVASQRNDAVGAIRTRCVLLAYGFALTRRRLCGRGRRLARSHRRLVDGEECVDLVIGPALRLFDNLEVATAKINDDPAVTLLETPRLAGRVAASVVGSVLDPVPVRAFARVTLPHLPETFPPGGDAASREGRDDVADRLDFVLRVEVEVLHVAAADFNVVGERIVGDARPGADDGEDADSSARGSLRSDRSRRSRATVGAVRVGGRARKVGDNPASTDHHGHRQNDGGDSDPSLGQGVVPPELNSDLEEECRRTIPLPFF